MMHLLPFRYTLHCSVHFSCTNNVSGSITFNFFLYLEKYNFYAALKLSTAFYVKLFTQIHEIYYEFISLVRNWKTSWPYEVSCLYVVKHDWYTVVNLVYVKTGTTNICRKLNSS